MGPALVIFLASGLLAGWIGRAKGSSFLIWFVIGVAVPVIGVLVAAVYRMEIDEPRRACPVCGKVVPLHDALCTRCGSELDWTEEQLPPESAVAAR